MVRSSTAWRVGKNRSEWFEGTERVGYELLNKE
jgi:hypothetical protein